MLVPKSEGKSFLSLLFIKYISFGSSLEFSEIFYYLFPREYFKFSLEHFLCLPIKYLCVAFCNANATQYEHVVGIIKTVMLLIIV